MSHPTILMSVAALALTIFTGVANPAIDGGDQARKEQHNRPIKAQTGR